MLGLYDLMGITSICYILCATLKATCPQAMSKYLPCIAGLVGVVCGVVLKGWDIETIGYNVYQGLTAGLTAVGVKEITKLKERIAETYGKDEH